MGGETQKTSIVPRAGRGMVTAYDPASIGELVDSFARFESVFLRENAWCVRDKDLEGNLGLTEKLRAMTVFNRVLDTAGTIATYTIVHSGASITAFSPTGSTTLLDTVVSPFDIYFETMKNRLFWAGSNNFPKVWDGSGASAKLGCIAPSAAMGYTPYSLTQTSTKTDIGFTLTCVGGSDTVTKTAGTSFTTFGTAGADLIGKTIVIGGVVYTIASVTDATHLKLTIVFAIAGSASYAAQIYYGDLSWSDPPSYAYAYYNPTTGHVSNRSPVLTLTEKDMNTVNVNLGGIVSDGTLYNYGYTQIILFRTDTQLGGTLAPLVLLPNSGGTIVYNDSNPDSILGVVIGAYEAPTTNNPPPKMRFMCSYQGRLWGVEEANPWRIRFSGDSNQIPLGRPEECWPERNFRDMEKGTAIGLKVVGSTLIVMGEEATMFVSGSGPGDYELERLSTRGFGVSQRAIDEHPGDSGTDTASAVFVSRDRRCWRLSQGGKLTEIGITIQDKLDAVNLSVKHPFIVKCGRVGKLWVVALGISATPQNIAAETPASLVPEGATTPHTGVVAITNGSASVVYISGNPFITDGSWSGTQILLNGVAYTIDHVATQTQLFISGTYAGATASDITYLVESSSTVSGGYSYYFYDFDTETWMDWGYAEGGMSQAVMSGIASSTGEIFFVLGRDNAEGSLVDIVSLLRKDGTALPDPLLQMQEHDMGDAIAKKSLEAIWLYTSSEVADWQIPTISYDGVADSAGLERQVITSSPRNRGQRIEVYVPKAPHQWHSIQPTIEFPSTPNARLFRVEFYWKAVSTGSAGKPS